MVTALNPKSDEHLKKQLAEPQNTLKIKHGILRYF
jgi:hypothetical protein